MGFGAHYLSARAQVATEYLMLVGVCLIIIAALSSYAFTQYGGTISNSHSIELMKELVEGANKAYSLGDGSTVLVTVTIPDDVSDIHATGQGLYITSNAFGTPSTDLRDFNFFVSTTNPFPFTPGSNTIAVSNVNGAVVFRVA